MTVERESSSNISYTLSNFTFLSNPNTLTFGATVRLSGKKIIFHLILYSNIKMNEVAKRGGRAGGEQEARCQRAPPYRRSLQPVKSPVHAGPALEAARTVQLSSP